MAPQIFQAHLVFSLPQPWNQSLLQEAQVPIFWRMVFRSQNLGTRCDHGCWNAISSRSSHWTEVGNTYLFINSSANNSSNYYNSSNNYFCIYHFVYILQNHEFILIPPIPSQHHWAHASLSLFLNGCFGGKFLPLPVFKNCST